MPTINKRVEELEKRSSIDEKPTKHITHITHGQTWFMFILGNGWALDYGGRYHAIKRIKTCRDDYGFV